MKLLTDRLALWHPFTGNNPTGTKNVMSMTFIFDLTCFAIFDLRELGDLH
jgi:hypothetical protein